MIGKTKSQGWEIGVSRTLPVSIEQAWALIVDALGLPPALAAPEDGVPEKGTAFEAKDQTRIEIRSYEQYSLIRMKWQPPGWDMNSTLQIRVRPAKTGTTISVHHEWLENAAQREAMRVHWTTVLEGFREAGN